MTQYRTDVLYEGYDTLAERFQAAGYSTIGVLNQVHLQSRFGFAQGFDHFEAVRGLGAGKLNQKLLKQLEGASTAPFFAYLHYLDVHWPYTNRLEGKQEAFGPLRMTSEPPQRGNRVAGWIETLKSESDLDALVARYDQEVAFVDAAIDDLMRALQAMDLYENTIVVVTSDHGEGFLEHDKLLHSFTPYDEVIRVPLVFRLPESRRTPIPKVDAPAGLVDLMPTLLELANLPPVPQAQGQSLVPLMLGEPAAERWIFAESADAVAVRSSTHKLIRFHDGHLEFYDLGTDPEEQSPRTAACVDLCGQMAEQLVGHQRAMSELRQSGQDGETGHLEEESSRSSGASVIYETHQNPQQSVPTRGSAGCLTAILLLGLAACNRQPSEPEPPRRVFRITVDTLRADHMGIYGYPRQTSPALDRLAEQGVTFAVQSHNGRRPDLLWPPSLRAAIRRQRV